MRHRRPVPVRYRLAAFAAAAVTFLAVVVLLLTIRGWFGA